MDDPRRDDERPPEPAPAPPEEPQSSVHAQPVQPDRERDASEDATHPPRSREP